MSLWGGLRCLEERLGSCISGCTVGGLAVADSKLEDVVLEDEDEDGGEDDDDMPGLVAGLTGGGDSVGVRMMSASVVVGGFHVSRRACRGSWLGFDD